MGGGEGEFSNLAVSVYFVSVVDIHLSKSN